MPRTAITLGKTHKGKWQLLATPDDNFSEQKKNFREMRVDKSHEELALVIYQENDGTAEVLKLVTPAEKKKQDDARTKMLASAAELGKENRGENKPDAEEIAAPIVPAAPPVEVKAKP
jgi:hypothetical protein